MIKLLGVLLLSIASVIPGFILNHRLVVRKKYLNEMSLLTLNIKNRIIDGGECVSEILLKESNGCFSFLKNLSLNNLTSFDEMKNILINKGFESTDSIVIAEFFGGLGRMDTKGERDNCDYYHNKFCCLINDAENELKDKGKLYKSLFVSLGIAVFIIFI